MPTLPADDTLSMAAATSFIVSSRLIF